MHVRKIANDFADGYRQLSDKRRDCDDVVFTRKLRRFTEIYNVDLKLTW